MTKAEWQQRLKAHINHQKKVREKLERREIMVEQSGNEQIHQKVVKGILRGPIGPMGPQGPMGPMGPPGERGTDREFDMFEKMCKALTTRMDKIENQLDLIVKLLKDTSIFDE